MWLVHSLDVFSLLCLLPVTVFPFSCHCPAEKDVIAGSRRKSSKGSYDPGEYDSGSDWDGEPGVKKGGRRGRPRSTGDSDGESGGEGDVPKKKRGRPPAGKSAVAAATGGEAPVTALPEEGAVPPQRRNSKGRGKRSSKTDLDIPTMSVPVKRRSRSFGSFERDSLGSIFSLMPDLRNAYYALQGMVRIQVSMRGIDGFEREDLRELGAMLQNPRSVVNLPIPYTSEIMMCLDIIEVQSHNLTEALTKLLLMKCELEQMPVKQEGGRRGKNSTVHSPSDPHSPTTTSTTDNVAVVKDTSEGVMESVVGASPLKEHSWSTGDKAAGVLGSSTGGAGPYESTSRETPLNPIAVMRKAYERGDHGKRPLSSFIPLPDPQVAVPVLKANMKLTSVANICTHVIPPTFASKEDRAFIARQVHLNRADIKRNRPVIMEEIRSRKMRRLRAWEVLGDRYVGVKHQWEHHLKHTAPTENEEEDTSPLRLRSLSTTRQPNEDGMGSPRTARISALRATSDMCKNDVDQDKILQQLAMAELKRRRLKFGIASIVDMLSPWQNADSSVPPVAPTFPVKGMFMADWDYMGALDEKQCTDGFLKDERFPAYVVEPPIIVDLHGSRLTTDGKRQLCSALPESKSCPPTCNCAKQVDKIERQCRPWSDMEKCIFVDKFMQFPKNFPKIAAYLVNRTTKDCIKFYYDSKTTIPFKSLLREFDNRKRNLKNSWTHTCAVATSVGGAVCPPEDVDEKEHLYELPVDDIAYNTLCSHPLYMASALGFESSQPDEIGTHRRKQVKYMQMLPPRYSTQLLHERRSWKRESSGAAGTAANGQAAIPQYMGVSSGPGASRKFAYPSMATCDAGMADSDPQYGGYAQNDSSWFDRNRGSNQVRQRKPKEPLDNALFISSDLIPKERKVEVLSSGPGSPSGTGRGGRGRGRRGRRANNPSRGGGRTPSREGIGGAGRTITAPGAGGETIGIGASSVGRGRGRGRGRGTRGRGRGRGRSSHKSEVEASSGGGDRVEHEGGVDPAEGEGGDEAIGKALEERDDSGTVNGDGEGEEDAGENEEGGEEEGVDDDEGGEEEGGDEANADGDDVYDSDAEADGEGDCENQYSNFGDAWGSSGGTHISETAIHKPTEVACIDTAVLPTQEDVVEEAPKQSLLPPCQDAVAVTVTASSSDDWTCGTSPGMQTPVHLMPAGSPRSPRIAADVACAELPLRAAFIMGAAPTTLLQSGTTLSINSAPLSGMSLPPPDVLPMPPASAQVPTDAASILPALRTDALLSSQAAEMATSQDGEALRSGRSESTTLSIIAPNGAVENKEEDDVLIKKRKIANISISGSSDSIYSSVGGDGGMGAVKRVTSGDKETFAACEHMVEGQKK